MKVHGSNNNDNNDNNVIRKGLSQNSPYHNTEFTNTTPDGIKDTLINLDLSKQDPDSNNINNLIRKGLSQNLPSQNFEISNTAPDIIYDAPLKQPTFSGRNNAPQKSANYQKLLNYLLDTSNLRLRFLLYCLDVKQIGVLNCFKSN